MVRIALWIATLPSACRAREIGVTFCCEMMRDQVQTECDRHSDPCECPDNMIHHNSDPSDERYGLFIHDGGSSYITIRYWPWCGTGLPDGVDDENEQAE